MTITTVQEDAPAKINLTLHVTGRRPDRYHLLDSLVVFADVGDRLDVVAADRASLRVTGPRADGVPVDASNLVLKAVRWMGLPAQITLEKHLPAMARIGGGSSDAAATLRALSRITGQEIPSGTEALGADVPVCIPARAARMQGVGEIVTPLTALPALHGVLVNPGVDVPTPQVFKHLTSRTNAPMPDALPRWTNTDEMIDWLAGMRNDLEPPAIEAAPVIGDVLTILRDDPACRLARMSGSGATCFALTNTRKDADAMASRFTRPDWWVQPVSFA